MPSPCPPPATPDYQQNTTAGLYIRKQVTHNTSTNGKYSPDTVSTAGTPANSWQQYLPTAAEAMTYDADGNLLTDGRWTYIWDAENRLLQMDTPAQTGSNPVPGTRLVFSYDGLSRRSKKEVYSTTPSAWTLTLREHYVYDGWNLVLTARENNAATPVVKRHACYVWGPDLASLPYGRSDWQRAGGVDGLLMVLDGVDSALAYNNVDYNGAAAGLGTPPADPTDDNYFPITDHLGNIKALFKAEYGGAITPAAILDYDAFGRELRSTGRAADIVPFHFSTKFTDPESGLNYYGYRFYDPTNGRWLNRDPMEENGGRNIYVMGFNNNISYVDVLGCEPFNFDVYEMVRDTFSEDKKILSYTDVIEKATIEIKMDDSQCSYCQGDIKLSMVISFKGLRSRPINTYGIGDSKSPKPFDEFPVKPMAGSDFPGGFSLPTPIKWDGTVEDGVRKGLNAVTSVEVPLGTIPCAGGSTRGMVTITNGLPDVKTPYVDGFDLQGQEMYRIPWDFKLEECDGSEESNVDLKPGKSHPSIHDRKERPYPPKKYVEWK